MAIKTYRLRNENMTILEPPAGKQYAITTMMIVNNSSTNMSYFDMHFVPNGDPVSDGTPGNGSTLAIKNLELSPEETFTFDTEKIILDEGDRVVIFSQPGVDDDPDLPIGNAILTNLGVVISYLEV